MPIFYVAMQMPINKSEIVFIGNAGGICGYMSHGINIIRKSSSLTGKRVEKDPSFKGFRNSCNRMKEASPIAASLYKLLPKEEKEYSLYRTLTGEALKMIKHGFEKEEIIARLKEEYINPVIERLQKSKQVQKLQTNIEKPGNNGNNSLFCKSLFKVHPYDMGGTRHVRLKRNPQYSNAVANQASLIEEYNSNEVSFQQHLQVNFISKQSTMTLKQKRIFQYSELIYMGKCKDCKGLKMWIRPNY
jgi:hypothetical protein